MKKYIVIIIGIVISMNSFAQVDAIKIAAAKKAYDNKDYQIALDELSEVTNVGRKTKLFLYYKGYTHYSLNQYDSAEVYLKKFLLLDINNTDVANTLADIEYQKKKIEENTKKVIEQQENKQAEIENKKKEFQQNCTSIISILNNYSCEMDSKDKSDGTMDYYTSNYSIIIDGTEATIIDRSSGAGSNTIFKYKFDLTKVNYSSLITEYEDEYSSYINPVYSLRFYLIDESGMRTITSGGSRDLIRNVNEINIELSNYQVTVSLQSKFDSAVSLSKDILSNK